MAQLRVFPSEPRLAGGHRVATVTVQLDETPLHSGAVELDTAEGRGAFITAVRSRLNGHGHLADTLDARLRKADAKLFPDQQPSATADTAGADPERVDFAARGLHTAAELQHKEFAAIRWAVAGLVPEGLTILAGKPKLGKSWQALGFCVAVASGGAALGQIRVEQGDALYLALEDSERRLQSRLRAMLGEEDTWPTALHYATDWPRLNAGGLALIEAWLDEHPHARLVAIDTYQHIKPKAGRGSAYEEDYDAITPLQQLAIRRGIAILVVMHCRKADAEDVFDTVTGTLGNNGGADTVLVLRRNRGEADAGLWVTGRDIETERELALAWDTLTSGWMLVDDALLLSRERQDVLQLLTAHGALTPTQAAAMLGKPVGTMNKLMWAMAQDGQLVADHGRYRLPLGGPPPPDDAKSGKDGKAGNEGKDGKAGKATAPEPTDAPSLTRLTADAPASVRLGKAETPRPDAKQVEEPYRLTSLTALSSKDEVGYCPVHERQLLMYAEQTSGRCQACIEAGLCERCGAVLAPSEMVVCTRCRDGEVQHGR